MFPEKYKNGPLLHFMDHGIVHLKKQERVIM
jgi:hypothetical protein